MNPDKILANALGIFAALTEEQGASPVPPDAPEPVSEPEDLEADCRRAEAVQRLVDARATLKKLGDESLTVSINTKIRRLLG